MHEAMLEALVEELDEKGIIRYSDWQERAKKKLAEQEEAVEDRGPAGADALRAGRQRRHMA